MSITLAQICDAVETTLAPAITYTQSYNEIKEGMADQPTLMVYPQSGTSAPPQATDRTTFQATVRQAEIEIYADLYATVRSEIGEDLGILLPLIDAVIDEIEKQDTKPYFGLVGIKAWNIHSAQRVTFEYADAKYPGIRFELMMWIY